MPRENEIKTSLQQGLVISYFGNSVAVESPTGQVFQCHLHRNQELPVVGDQVLWAIEKSDTGSVAEVLPRRSALLRGNKVGKTKVIAANLDYLLVVMAPPPVFSSYLVDRYLLAAEILDLQAVLVLNKNDLIEKSGISYDFLAPYQAIPYPIILASTITHEGLDQIADLLQHKTGVLLGPSGVGKSSIISLLAEENIRVNTVSAKGIGKHTTTATRWYHLPNGGGLIDSPGVREFNLWPISKENILKGFKEFLPFASSCKFRDCSHGKELDCGIKIALSDQLITQQRYDSYFKLLKELSLP